jgi:hypothetical protein
MVPHTRSHLCSTQPLILSHFHTTGSFLFIQHCPLFNNSAMQLKVCLSQLLTALEEGVATTKCSLIKCALAPSSRLTFARRWQQARKGAPYRVTLSTLLMGAVVGAATARQSMQGARDDPYNATTHRGYKHGTQLVCKTTHYSINTRSFCGQPNSMCSYEGADVAHNQAITGLHPPQ